MTKPLIRLDEVTLMRTVLAILIVFTHSFTCYNGSWREPAGYVDIPFYKWLARLSFAFTLEGFVFVSGYLYAFQRIALKRSFKVVTLIVNKFKRLILPSIVFSIFYFLLFYEFKGMGKAVYSIVSGCGHMWYLPMLFWCFVYGWLLEQVKIGDGWKMALLVALNLLNFISLPLRISTAFSYIVYFYGGYLVYKYFDVIRKHITLRNTAILWTVFVIVFSVLRPLRDALVINSSYSNVIKVLIVLCNHAGQLVYASTGLIAFYMTVFYLSQHHQVSAITVKIAACSFGIYLLQQFILQLLYYYSSFPLLVGPYWLPWCGFVIALVVSYLFSSLMLKTKVGQFLIG